MCEVVLTLHNHTAQRLRVLRDVPHAGGRLIELGVEVGIDDRDIASSSRHREVLPRPGEKFDHQTILFFDRDPGGDGKGVVHE